jgi:hypothetical protein
MDDVLILIKQTDDGETTRDVFCRTASIGMKEFYEANAHDFYPEMKFILADHLDYEGEQLCEHDGRRYRVLRTYRAGQELEITVTRASAEEGGVYE